MIKLINAMLWNPNSDIKLCPLTSFVWHFHLKTDPANWKLTYSDLSVLDNFVSARFYCAGNVLFCSSGCLILFDFSLFSPDGAVMCSALQCSSAPVQQQLSTIIRDSRSPRGPPAFSLLQKEVAHGENTLEMHLDLEMSHCGAGSAEALWELQSWWQCIRAITWEVRRVQRSLECHHVS